MTVLDYLGICAVYGVVTCAALWTLSVPWPRALTAGAWMVVLALVGITIPLAVFGVGCDVGENLGAAHVELCRDLERTTTLSSVMVLASPIVSTALMVGGVFGLSRGRPGDGMVAVAVVAAPAVPFLYLWTVSGLLA